MPQLPQLPDISGEIVTVDAMSRRKDIAQDRRRRRRGCMTCHAGGA
ncbi:MAG: hypothetical protein ACYC26_06305 [Phycisphaerales bacterium]